MKIKALAEELNLDWNSFEDWLLNHQSTYRARRDFFNAVIDGNFDRNQIRSDFAAWLKQSKEAAEQAIIQEEECKSELARLEAERIRADEAAAFERERRMKAIDSMYVSTVTDGASAEFAGFSRTMPRFRPQLYMRRIIACTCRMDIGDSPTSRLRRS